MAKKARTSRPRRAAAPADGFAAPPADDMDIEEEEPSPRRRKQKEAPLACAWGLWRARPAVPIPLALRLLAFIIPVTPTVESQVLAGASAA